MLLVCAWHNFNKSFNLDKETVVLPLGKVLKLQLCKMSNMNYYQCMNQIHSDPRISDSFPCIIYLLLYVGRDNHINQRNAPFSL